MKIYSVTRITILITTEYYVGFKTYSAIVEPYKARNAHFLKILKRGKKKRPKKV